MRRNGFTWFEFVVVVAILLILAAILFPVFQRAPNHEGRRPACQSNLRQIGLSFKQYIQDAGEKFPPLAVARSGNWAGSLQPYLKNWQVFQCPSAPQHRLKTTDYFTNARLAAKHEAALDFQSNTILAGDGDDDSPTNYALANLQQSWRGDQKSPATRHLDGANYLFADGHTKFLQPDKIAVKTAKSGFPTFSIN